MLLETPVKHLKFSAQFAAHVTKARLSVMRLEFFYIVFRAATSTHARPWDLELVRLSTRISYLQRRANMLECWSRPWHSYSSMWCLLLPPFTKTRPPRHRRPPSRSPSPPLIGISPFYHTLALYLERAWQVLSRQTKVNE